MATTVQGSVLYAVRKAVVDGVAGHLAQQPAYANVDAGVLWRPSLREQVHTTRARYTHRSASMRAGYTHRDERGYFDLVVLIAAVGESHDYAAERAAEIGAIAEEWVAFNRSTLGVPGVNWLHVNGDGTASEFFGDRTTWAEMTYPIEYDARLS